MTDRRVTISTARTFAKKRGLTGVLIIGFTADGRAHGASYGSNRERCQAVGKLLDEVMDGCEQRAALSVLRS